MKENDVAMFVQEKLHYFDTDAITSTSEIGDGNINYIFRVKEEKSGKSIIVKQAADTSRISKDLHISRNRGKIEVRALEMQNKIAEGFVPKVYFYDETMCAIIMEDMCHHEMMRNFLMSYKICINFTEDISTFLCLEHNEKKEFVKLFTNPDLCKVTENLVFTEPYQILCKNNCIYPPNEEYVNNEIYGDSKLHLEVTKLKYEFMTNTQTLIHGDLHTGSIFINEKHIFIFDSEFSCYGPIGYDIGNLISNLFFSWCYAEAELEENDTRKNEFCNWILDTIKNIIDLFIKKYNELFDIEVSDPMARVPGFKEYYLSEILKNIAGSAGVESIRRIVGMAKVIEITQITDKEKRTKAERIILTLGKRYIKDRDSFKKGQDYLNVIKQVVSQYRE